MYEIEIHFSRYSNTYEFLRAENFVNSDSSRQTSVFRPHPVIPALPKLQFIFDAVKKNT